jgi:thiol-disulfide isomerase/thioredoxin
MSKLKLFLAASGAAVALSAAVYFAGPFSGGSGAQKNGPAVARGSSADAVFAASFKDLEGKPQALSQWRGKVMVLNFWAPWCPPCREEMPDFIRVQEKYRDRGLVFVGLALDEQDKVSAFADEMGVNYPILLGELEAVELARNIGNRLGGLPFTAVIDRRGKVVFTQVGGLNQAHLEKVIVPLL